MGATFTKPEEAIERAKFHAAKTGEQICVFIKGLVQKEIGDAIGFGLFRGRLCRGAYWLAFPDGTDRACTREENKEGARLTRNARARQRRSLQDEAAEACGMTKVRGALGGIYYE